MGRDRGFGSAKIVTGRVRDAIVEATQGSAIEAEGKVRAAAGGVEHVVRDE